MTSPGGMYSGQQVQDVPLEDISSLRRNPVLADVMAQLLKDQFGYDAFLNEMNTHIPDALPDRGDVMLENKEMLFIEHKIDKLNNLKVTGGWEFANPYLEGLRVLGGEERMKLLMKADHYTARSYYMNVWHEGRYSRTMTDLLDRVLYGKVDSKRAGSVYYAINS